MQQLNIKYKIKMCARAQCVDTAREVAHRTRTLRPLRACTQAAHTHTALCTNTARGAAHRTCIHVLCAASRAYTRPMRGVTRVYASYARRHARIRVLCVASRAYTRPMRGVTRVYASNARHHARYPLCVHRPGIGRVHALYALPVYMCAALYGVCVLCAVSQGV